MKIVFFNLLTFTSIIFHSPVQNFDEILDKIKYDRYLEERRVNAIRGWIAIYKNILRMKRVRWMIDLALMRAHVRFTHASMDLSIVISYGIDTKLFHISQILIAVKIEYYHYINISRFP